MFDIKSYLEDRNIVYTEEGKNTTQGWVNIQCVFPFCSDKTNHLGINLETGNYSCWKCGESGRALELIMVIDKCSYKEAKRILYQFQTDDVQIIEKEETQKDLSRILPKEISKDFPNLHLNYLRKRGYDPEYLIKKYDLYSIYNVGEYKFRIIVPFYYGNKLITFSSVSVLGKGYRHAPKRSSEIDPKNALYNIDNCKDSVVLVEGLFDCWRIGDGALALMGVKYTPKQIEQIVMMNFKRILVMFDADALDVSYSLANQLAPFVNEVDVVEIVRGDPDELSLKYVNKVRLWLK